MASRYGQGSVHFDANKRLWVGRVELEPSPDGQRQRKVIKGKVKSEVLSKMREAQTARDRGDTLGDGTLTVEAWLRHWADNIVPARDLSERSIADYRYQVDQYLIPRLGRHRLTKLTAEHVEGMMRTMREDDGLAPRTVAYARTVLRMALNVAVQRGKAARNVVAQTAAPKKTGTRLDDALDGDEASKVIAAARDDRLEALAVLVLSTGLRQGEALRLLWSDIDLDGATVTVRKAKTPSGVRTIALPALAVASLRTHKHRQNVERMAASAWAEPELVFASTVGTTLNRSNLLRWWYELTIKAGVGRRRFHASRHTAATLMLNNGVPLEVVSATLGHAGLAITADIYAKVRPELQRTAATAMDNVLGGSQ